MSSYRFILFLIHELSRVPVCRYTYATYFLESSSFLLAFFFCKTKDTMTRMCFALGLLHIVGLFAHVNHLLFAQFLGGGASTLCRPAPTTGRLRFLSLLTSILAHSASLHLEPPGRSSSSFLSLLHLFILCGQ